MRDRIELLANCFLLKAILQTKEFLTQKEAIELENVNNILKEECVLCVGSEK